MSGRKGTRRRRRLTLAPRALVQESAPTRVAASAFVQVSPCSASERVFSASESAQGSGVVESGSVCSSGSSWGLSPAAASSAGGISCSSPEEAAVEAELKVERVLGRRLSAPCLLSSSDPLVGVRGEGRGSRFWQQAGEVSSDEEVEEVGGSSIASGDLSGQEALALFSPVSTGVSVEMLNSIGFSSRIVGSVVGGSGQGRRSRSTAGQVAGSGAQMRGSPGIKPWKGPLPARGVSPKLLLGEVWVRDLKSKRSSQRLKLVEDVARRRTSPRPWRGPLPARRSSPRLTLGDALAKAQVNPSPRKKLDRRHQLHESLSLQNPCEDSPASLPPATEDGRLCELFSRGGRFRPRFPARLGEFFSRGGRFRPRFLASSRNCSSALPADRPGLQGAGAGLPSSQGSTRKATSQATLEANIKVMAEQIKELEAKIKGMEVRILDMACDLKINNKCCDKVLVENDNVLIDEMVEDVFIDEDGDLLSVEGDGATTSNDVGVLQAPMEEMVHHGLTPAGAGQRLAAPEGARQLPDAARLQHPALAQEAPKMAPLPPASTQDDIVGSKSFEERIAAAAGIKEVLVTPTRSSPRLATTADEHVMDKVERRVALNNLEQVEGQHIGSGIGPC